MTALRADAALEQLLEDTAGERRRVRQLVHRKAWSEAEPDPARLRGYISKVRKTVRAGAESITGATLDLQHISFLVEGAEVRRAVAYVEVSTPSASEVGSGFLVSPRLFLTCQHVVADVSAARGTQITFDRELDENGRLRRTTTCLLDPDSLALFSPSNRLDYALIAVGEVISGAAISGLPFCILSDTPDRHAIGMNVNIIQHPRGWPKMTSMRNNLLTHRTPRTLLYETDTDQGSSGAPVFNDNWDVVALHHWGQPFLETIDDQGTQIPVNVNEGVRISAIFRDLQLQLPTLPPPQRELLSEALNYGSRIAPAPHAGKTLSPPRVRHSESKPINPIVSEPMILPLNNELRVTVPVEITVRVGDQLNTAAASAVISAESVKMLSRGAEKLKIDKDYGSRIGYVSEFIPGVDLPLPSANKALARQIAPLRAGEDNAEEGELKYEHFSVKMNKGKRMAIFTATNIDGETYLAVDRKTGEVSDAEGETWFKDPRISASFYLDQTFYSEWSTYFDRGHLTRRTDPTWGTAEEAERANADTYHFTNCSPQHFRFNQTTQYWQGAERYLLERGVLATDSRKRLVVFQGPIFNDQVDHWADDVQIPSSFFKVIAWKGSSGLKAVGLIVDQLQLLSEPRTNLGQPRGQGAVDVSQWRVSISTIESRTGLDFGKVIRDADTIGTGEQPHVGEEAARIINSFDDLLPDKILRDA
jgi:endonuclease G